MRATMTRLLNHFGATIVMTFRKPSAGIAENNPPGNPAPAASKPKSPFNS
jgi:hypothetical protein